MAITDDEAIQIAIPCEDWIEALPDVETLSRRAAALALRGAPTGAEVSLVLSDDEEVHALNRMWRSQDKPTNVLSFPGDDHAAAKGAPFLLGDVIVAFETARREVDEDHQAATLADHLSHLIIHGVLHLRGHDHEIDAEAEEMEQLETKLLQELGVPDPYAVDHGRRD